MEPFFLERKERIILTTIDIMNEFGVHSVSTKEIAAREKITEAAIFKHFPKKNDLYLGVLNYFSKYDDDIYESIKLKKLNPIDSIIYFYDMYTSYFQNYPEITVLINSFDELRYNKALTAKIDEIIDARVNFLKEYITKAQKSDDISSELDAEILVHIFIGTISSICFSWRRQNYGFSLKEQSNKAIKILLKSFKN